LSNRRCAIFLKWQISEMKTNLPKFWWCETSPRPTPSIPVMFEIINLLLNLWNYIIYLFVVNLFIGLMIPLQ
jgi:hypothetical protein